MNCEEYWLPRACNHHHRHSPSCFHARLVLGSGYDGKEVEELRLKDPGEDGTEDPGVVLVVTEEDKLDRTAAAAPTGLQCGQT